MTETMTKAYEKVLEILNEYLGPTSGRFLDRNIRFHLQKEPDQFTFADVPKIIEWVKIGIGVLSRDAVVADECANKMKQAVK
ncbi:MAG: hypothetical protein A3B23_02940 [Candidatus Colwellbacteria bacterium RIFCSPLOWO2_01_FULL_48_10]|uniref:Uncharacterized protein n=1 Tax=Candidatus Colwellbacteria bacterium RIFCSPLOWO2_01_FULL_48_10 TaxID=1797690 RepID=A0A1G1Z818_9BACT|nr:MAG: hypothetical protein A3B23_02940 [Candidatus Colwellbacteria bacterium RIFCSPLOWO2_01_FULL_48_10]